ncbi:MAG: response regulator [Candidatus Omnitrophota bacterium]
MDKKRILIIDDENSLTQIMKRNLESTGRYEVRTENAGLPGIIAAKEFKPTVILLDVMMPGMDGGEVAYQLSKDENTKNIPIIFLTAAILKDEAEKSGRVITKHVFIAKPIAIEELTGVIEKWTQ